jgi:glycosyltransferase involved in cell wall biosynthesis
MVSAISAISTVLAERAKDRGCRRVYLLPSAEDFAHEPPRPPLQKGTFKIAYVGALIARDNPEFLAALVDELAKMNVDVSFDIAGRYESASESRPYVDRLSAHVSAGRVRLHGKVDDRRLGELLAQADALILPRRDAPPEIAAFPTRLAECLKTARPVLACSVGDIPMHLKDGEEAILLDSADVHSAAMRIAEVVSSPDRGAAIGLRGYYAGRRCFDRLNHARELMNLANK